MNGKTLILSSGENARPQQETAPPYLTDFSRADRAFPPRTSTPAVPYGLHERLFRTAVKSVREMMLSAPRLLRKGSSSGLPVTAHGEKPSAARMESAMLPTPPV
ncbi:MAG: hypothetical protein LRY51_18645, partial [Geovibrio sp.]|nr:hypothetical protein [Geovibrio sp.]